ncbi:chemotaxis-specific protein-glutamate methyltransferase CheB [Ideonella sp. DXS29W]|uniref:Protein-glutamate methylesterase/protein-glutamine glutaminase n=1 Tax=Ideonella lacteola TaxID=2984193 RepID=A0ABU9BVA5_9BURK
MLIVDDSALMRKVLRQVLSDAGFEVVSARSGGEGVAMVRDFRPDVITLDINMPEMDGLTALSLLMTEHPTPVVMVSSLTQQGAMSTLEALALGAVDYVTKPGGTISLNLRHIADELVRKVQAASQAQVRGDARRAPLRQVRPTGRKPASTNLAPQRPAVAHRSGQPPGLVLVGVSTGGPRTLEDVLPFLPADFPWPVLVVQHMPAHFTSAFARRMDQMCELQVRECDGPMPLQAGQIVIAQGGRDLVVAERLGRLVAQPIAESPAHPWHPCVDVLVDSALRQMPADRLVGVLLTGMGDDGAASMARLRAQGGHTIAESAETAVVFGMPQELIARQGAEVVLPSDQVSAQLLRWAKLH